MPSVLGHVTMISMLDRVCWPKLAIGFFLTAVGALSVHVVMLQILDVPFPDLSVIPAAYKFVIRAVATLGLIVFWQFAAQKMQGSFVKQWGALFLIASMLTESLIRGPFMEGYCTTAWIFAFVGNIPKLLTIALSSAMIVAATPRLRRAWQEVLAAVVLTAITTFAATPLIGAAFGPIMESIARLAPQSEWCTLPYGPNVLIPAYLTFAEPVVACLAAAILIWDTLSASRALRFAQFALIILAIKNQLLMPWVYAAFAKTPFLEALTSESQFALEAVALAVLTGITWEWGAKQER
jgi:hypothetical protein